MTPVLKKKKKRYLVLILVPVFIALVALLPFLLSSSSALQLFVNAVNAKISGTLSVESWLIGWQQGVLCQNVVYSNPEQGISVSLPSITSNKGLVELVLAPKNLGIVQVESPLVKLSGPAVQAFFSDEKTVTPVTGQSKRSAGNDVPFWDQIFVKLKSRDGQLSVNWDAQDITVAVKNVSVDSTLAGGTAAFEIGFHAMELGYVEATGSLNLPAHEYGWLETIVVESEVKVSSLQLRDFLQAGAVVTKLPHGEGLVNADFRLKIAGLDGIQFNGLAELTDLRLTGGFLGDDQPAFHKVHLTVDEGKWTDRGWGAKRVELVSDTLNMTASGEFLPEAAQLSAQGVFHLPVLFDQFQRFLRVHESTFVETGIFDFTVDMSGTGSDLSMKLKAKTNNIGGIFQDQPFYWTSPMILFFNGEKKGAQLQVSALQFDAPFAQIKGSGGLHSFAMDAFLDLDQAFADIGTLFQFDIFGSGAMELTMKSDLAEGNADRFKVAVDLNVNDFMLRRREQPIIPLHQFALSGEFKAPNAIIAGNNGELDIQFVLSSWLGELFLVVNGEKNGDGPFKGYFTTDAEFDLTQVTPLLHTFNKLDSETRMKGAMQVQATGFTGDPPLEIRDLTAEISNFSLEGNGSVFNDPLVKLQIMQPVNDEVPFLSLRDLKIAASKEKFFHNGAGLNLLDFSTRKVILHNVHLRAESGTLALDRLMIPDWQKPYDSDGAQFSLSVDLGKMTEVLQAFGLLTADTAFSGSAQASLLLAEKKEASTQEMGMNAQIVDFGLKRWQKTVVDSQEVDFSSRLHGQIPFGEISVDELKLGSNTLKLDATGKVSSLDNSKLHVDLSGLMNEGRFELVTDTDFIADPAVIKTLGSSQVMTGVELNDTLARILFSRIHPLFGVLARPTGLIDVRLDSLWCPIGTGVKNEANFAAIFDVRKIVLESSALLKSILVNFGLAKEQLQLQDNEIYCIAKNGRIKCSPVRLLAGDAEILMGGSVDLDRSLDYELKVPITNKLGSGEGYKVFEGTSVTVVVKGTTEDPSYDEEAVKSTIQSLMKQAVD